MAPCDTPSDRNRLVSLHRLRGLAALFVVAGHAFGITGLSPAKDLLAPGYLLIASGTSLFVLISGALFSMKAIPRLETRQTKTRELLARRWRELAPFYLAIGVPLALIISFNQLRFEGINPLTSFPSTMLNGGMSYSYWYVPFFLCMVALAPVHVWFSRRRLAVQTALIVLGLIVSSIVHRPSNSAFYSPLHAVLYFLPLFWLGIVLGRNWPALLAALRGTEVMLATTALAVIAVQMAIGQREVYLHEFGRSLGDIDLFLPQKIALGLLMISLFDRTAHLPMPFLEWCARHSLAIFFLHSPLLILALWVENYSGFYMPEITLVTFLLLILSVRIDKAIRAVLGQGRDRRAEREPQAASQAK